MRAEDGPFGALRERLLKGGIAPRRVKRYLGELTDHLAELTDRELAAGYTPDEAHIRARALLGSDDELAQSWLAAPRLKSLTARAPWLMFGIVPPIAAILMLLPPTLLLVVISKANGLMQPHRVTPEWFQLLAGTIVHTGNLVLVPSVALLFSAIAQQQRLSWLWPWLASASLLFLSIRMGYRAGTIDHFSLIRVGMAPLILPGARASLMAEWHWVAAQWFLTLLPATFLGVRSRCQIKIG